jgi:sugar O-acyltransferase (sialic acid O-acetyltransferase NeuD family)
MNREKAVVIFGTGGTGSALHYNLSHDGAFKVAAFTVDREFMTEPDFMGCPVVPFDEIEAHYPPDRFQMIIALGYARVNHLRAERYMQAKDKGYSLLRFISPQAQVWKGFTSGDNCKIGSGSLLQPFSHIGNNVFIGSGCIIGHHSTIMDHVFIASGVTIAGGVTVEPYAFIGTGAVVRNRIRIAAESVVGAGAIILQDTDRCGVYLASPATKLKISSDKMSLLG